MAWSALDGKKPKQGQLGLSLDRTQSGQDPWEQVQPQGRAEHIFANAGLEHFRDSAQ